MPEPPRGFNDEQHRRTVCYYSERAIDDGFSRGGRFSGSMSVGISPSTGRKKTGMRLLGLLFLLPPSMAAGKADGVSAGGVGSGRPGRAGAVQGLEDGRISLAKISKMTTSSVDVEVRALL